MISTLKETELKNLTNTINHYGRQTYGKIQIQDH
jgi:hypothetical protein